MTTMKKSAVIALSTLLLASLAGAQGFSNETHEFMTAKLAAAQGRFDDALPLLRKVIASDPNNPVLHFEYASVLADAGRLDESEAELRKVAKAHPDFYDAQRLLGRMLFERAGSDRTKIDEALDHLRAAFRLNGDDFQTGMAVAQILVSTGRAEEGAKVLGQMVERAPDQRSLNYTYAQVLTRLGRGDESKKYLERAVLLDATFGPAVLQLADIYQKEGEWAKAAEVLDPLIQQEGFNVDLLRQQAFYHLRAGDAAKARTSFETILAADPKDNRSRFYLAEALSDLQKFEEAQKIYRSLLEQTPDDPELLLSFGLSLSAQRKFDEAAKNFHTLLGVRDVPANLQVVARTQLAYIELERGNLESALAMVKPILVFNDIANSQAINIGLEVLKKQKKFAEAVMFLTPLEEKFGSDAFIGARYIEMLVRAGDAQRAQQAAQTLAKFGPRNTSAAAEAYIQAGDPKAAIALLRNAIAAKPEEIDLQFSLGSAYERAGDVANAEKVFLALLEKDPDHAPTLNYLGYMWAERGVNLARAADMLKKAVAAEPRNGAYVDSLGWVYFQQGNLDLAERYLKDATQLLPRDATVHEHLGDVFAKRGDIIGALTMYRAALKLDPEEKEEAKLRLKIAELERKTQNAQR